MAFTPGKSFCYGSKKQRFGLGNCQTAPSSHICRGRLLIFIKHPNRAPRNVWLVFITYEYVHLSWICYICFVWMWDKKEIGLMLQAREHLLCWNVKQILWEYFVETRWFLKMEYDNDLISIPEDFNIRSRLVSRFWFNTFSPCSFIKFAPHQPSISIIILYEHNFLSRTDFMNSFLIKSIPEKRWWITQLLRKLSLSCTTYLWKNFIHY